MKIYIKVNSLSKLSNKIHLLKSYYINSQVCYEAFSQEGVFIIDKNSILKLNHTDRSIIHFDNYYNNISLAVDYSYTSILVTYQLPIEHVLIPYIYLFFKLTNNSNIQLVIQTIDLSINENDNNFLINLLPTDIYFESKEDIDLNNPFIKEEINVFLSHLN